MRIEELTKFLKNTDVLAKIALHYKNQPHRIVKNCRVNGDKYACFQILGYSSSGKTIGHKTFDIDKITGLEVLH